ncbi:hypothetical protein KEM55_001528 [Ascosphaera atra]|nr:hypothetical protein KEM55_001528 [Ascosphaera atra]
MGEEGDGELLEGRAEDAKAAVNALFKQPSPPTPAPQFQQTFIAGLGITFPSDAATITGNMDFYGGSSSNFWSQPMVPQASTMTNASTFVPFPPFPASPPNSSTAHSPFSSPPNSYTTDFTFAGDFSSPSPPPSHSTRLPQPLYCASSPPTSFANKYSSHYNDSGNASDAFACSPPTGFGMGFSPQPLFPSMLAEQRRDSIMSVSGFSGGSGEQYVEPVIPGFSQHFSP